jgi:hypothetical protein
MAYFSNGSEGMVFDEQCQKCKYGNKPCPIAFAQAEYNYSAVNNQVATDILNTLVTNNGTCQMWKEFEVDFAIDPNQLNLFN